jgi:hypothetical protein
MADKLLGVRQTVRQHPLLAAYTLVLVGGFTTYGIAIDAKLAVPYAIVVTGGALLVARINQRVGLTTGTLWGLAAWATGHMAGGTIQLDGDRVLYNAWLLPHHALRYDQAVHFVGFGFATYVCAQALARWLAPGAPRFGVGVMVALAGLGVGAANEIFEFFTTLLIKNTNVGGYQNTGWDLVADLAGAIVFAVSISRSGSATTQAGGPRR